MPTLQDLKTSILKMPHEEAFELVKKIRFERRQPLKKPFRKTAGKKAERKVSLSGMMKGMSEEQRLKLITELEGLQ